MRLSEKFCLFSLRAEGLLIDFTLVFLFRWILAGAGLDYVYLDGVFGRLPPLAGKTELMLPETPEFYGTMLLAIGLPEAIAAAIWAVYAVSAMHSYGRTIGMWFTGVRLVDCNGDRPGLLRVAARHVLSPLSAIFWIGYLAAIPWPGTLHDLLTGTRVVSGEGYSSCRSYARSEAPQE